MVATASPAIQKATAGFLKLSKDERARLIHEFHECEVRAWRDEMARLNNAVTGERIAIAWNMFNLKLLVETSIQATGLSIGEIEKLRGDS